MNYPGLISPTEWLKTIAQFFQASVEENKIIICPESGRGCIEIRNIEKGLDLVFTDITLNRDMHLHRQKSENQGVIIKCLIHTPSSFLVVKTEEDRYIITDGIYVSTAHSPDTNYIKAGYRFQVLSFHLSFEWIRQYSHSRSLILNTDTIARAFLIFEKITPAIQQAADNLFRMNMMDSPYKNLLFQSLSIELLAKTLSLFDYRMNIPLKGMIKNPRDINQLLLIREKLVSCIENGCPTIQSLADEFGISPTKLKTNFRIFFGKPLFQYFQQERMEVAKRMIENGHSVSDSGFRIGYTNLSKFSSAYKKHFGFTPKETHLS